MDAGFIGCMIDLFFVGSIITQDLFLKNRKVLFFDIDIHGAHGCIPSSQASQSNMAVNAQGYMNTLSCQRIHNTHVNVTKCCLSDKKSSVAWLCANRLVTIWPLFDSIMPSKVKFFF